ncbi:hypothetical protein CBR_g38949 [Chara braunii]|uniref:Myb-like domain-containing protein n=1 Tax=Chara braunii TaxID=69332 RepID=A0A388K0S3_CHABU|nr:hypothetical protein CBR_g38949 [Chara braunii]|eukprot:GBG63638.1 hypothetical protein CBR_g38949 [Chara braunii]
MGRSRSRSRSRSESPGRKKRRDESRKGRSPERRSIRSPGRSHEYKRRDRHKSRSSSPSSRRRRRSRSRDREEKRFEFPYNKPASDNRAWFTMELRDELYALRRELDKLKKKVDKLFDDFKEEVDRRKMECVNSLQMKQALDTAIRESNVSQVVTKPPGATTKTQRDDKKKADDFAKVSSDMQTLRRQMEDMQDLRYQLAVIQTTINTPARRPFISPRQKVLSVSKTPKKVTPSRSAAAPSRKKPAGNMDLRCSIVRSSARRRLLSGKQITEKMLSALQMEDLKQLCVKHNVKYKGMPQARVALRKVPGLVVAITEDLLDVDEDGEEVQGRDQSEEDPTQVSRSSEEGLLRGGRRFRRSGNAVTAQYAEFRSARGEGGKEGTVRGQAALSPGMSEHSSAVVACEGGSRGVGAGQGGRRPPTAEPPRRYDPSLYRQLESWETPLPPSDEEPETEELPTLPLASGSTQLLSQTVRAGGSASNEGGDFMSLLHQGLGDDDDGGLDLRFGLCSGGSREASRTFIIHADPSPRGVQHAGSQHTEHSTFRAGASVTDGVGQTAVARQHGSTAPSADRLTSTCPARNGVAAGSLCIGGARPSMTNRTTPTQPDLRDEGACRPPVRPGPTVENITRGVSNMWTHSDDGDDGGGSDDVDEQFREDVEAGDDDDNIPIWPLGKTGGRGRGRSRGAVRGRSVGRGGRGGVSDDGGKFAMYWSPKEQMQLVSCKRKQEMHLAGLSHNYGRMRTKEWKWDDIAKRMANAGRPKDAEDCMKKRGAGGGESVGCEAGGEGFPEERSFARDSDINVSSGAGGGKRKNARQQALESIADVMDRHGELMSSTIQSSSKRQCSIFTRQCDILEQEVAVQKAHYAASDETQRMMCHTLMEIVAAIRAAEGDYDEEFTTEEEQAEATTSAIRESGRQRSSDQSASKRMLTPPPEAQQLRARDTRTEKAVVVDLGGEDDEPLDRRRMHTRTTATPPPAVTPRAAVNERPVSGRLTATPSQPRQRNEGGDGGSVQRGGGGGVMADTRAVGAEAASAVGAGGSSTVAPVATAREEAAVAAATRVEVSGEKKGDREGGEPGSSRVHRGVITKDLIDRTVLWVDDKAFWTTGERRRLYNIVHDTREYFVAIASGLPPPVVPRSVVLPKSSTREGKIADQSQLQQAISRAAAMENVALRILHSWVFKSGNRPRGYHVAFQYSLESFATDIARAMWYGEEWCDVVSPTVCAHTIDLSGRRRHGGAPRVHRRLRRACIPRGGANGGAHRRRVHLARSSLSGG